MAEPTVVALGWATVDLERAAREHGASLAQAPLFVSVPRSGSLGARCLATRTVPGTTLAGRVIPDWLVLLEPDTEGRLAGYLARHGEGWAATWLASWPAPWPGGIQAAARKGPLGLERLAPDDPATGPFRLWLAAATIAW
jgi:hypothetical protein